MVVLDALSFGIAILFILVGVVGIIVPVLPGMILVWLSVLVFAWLSDFQTVSLWVLAVVTGIALVTGTASIWLPYLGAKKSGAAKRAIFLGFIGAIIGTFVMPLVGTIIGYGLGILVGEMLKHRDFQLAVKSSVGGVAGWGAATIVELAGALTILVLFVYVVLSG